MGLHKSTVARWIRGKEEAGKLNGRPRGRRRKTTAAQDQQIRRFNENHPFVNAREIQQTSGLNVLSACNDLSVFDPSTSVAARFYSSLLECVRRLSDVTYGVEVSWREAQVPGLLQTLAAWAAEGAAEGAADEARQLVAPALAALVNLCQRNLPAVVALMRAVDTRAFLCTLLSRKDPSPATKLQVCKLVVTVKQVQGGLQDSDVLSFCEAAFCAVGDALAGADAFLLRQIVDFFEDVRNDDRCRAALLRYENFRKDTEGVLGQLKDSPKPQCVSLLLQFLLPLVQLRIRELAPLYPDVAALALKWIVGETAGTAAMMVLCAIVSTVCGHSEDASPADEQKQVDRETARVRDAVLDLIEARIPVLSEIPHKSVTALFQPLLSSDKEESLFQEETINLHLQALQLLLELSSWREEWGDALWSSLRQPLLQLLLAAALLAGAPHHKAQALRLLSTPGFLKECGASLSERLCELQPLLVVPYSSARAAGRGGGSFRPHMDESMQQDLTPLFTIAQEGRLNQMMARLQEAFENKEIRDVSVSAIVDLYRCKIAALGNSEKALYARLEKADEEASRSQQLLSHALDGASRLLQRSRHSAELLEEARAELKDSDKAVRTPKLPSQNNVRGDPWVQVARLEETKTRLESALNAAEERCEAEEQRAEQLEQELQKATAETRELERSVQQLTDKAADQAKIIRRLQDKLAKKKEELKNLKNRSNNDSSSDRSQDARSYPHNVPKCRQEASTAQSSLASAQLEASRLQEELAESRAEAAAVRATLASRDVELHELRGVRREIARLSAKPDATAS
ncbi:uncharacterized protein LOC124594658 [Schistocerca americana]|uniref:uncharacterized protein LOC124594658 n=1 Tax=Schistocerca americana TaxID=7009 RepID=UPI001F501EE6|nr:uncharacterized protein LOC124594658 [Schistocerca americana]